MTWTANDPIENVTAYRIYYGSASRQYSNFKDVGCDVTSCELENIITTLEDGETYYLAATAKSATSESDFSTEVVYTHITALDAVSGTVITDADGDGISDEDELYLYGTDPTNTDSDNDGISDNKELIYWGTLWNEDFDDDGIINLNDWDSDGDGISDGDEITQGTDPAIPQLIVTLLSPEDGATLPAGDITFSCQATSQSSDIDHISFYSNISGSWQQDDIHYIGEISRNETGLISLFHFNNSTEDAVTSDNNESTNIEFSNTSQFGSSAYLSGYDNSITASNSTGRYNITDELTIEAWVYPTDITPWDYIVSKAWDVHTSPYINYALGFYNDSKTLRFVVTISGQQYTVTTGIISPDQWYHVVGTYSSSTGELIIYLNGQLVDSTSASGSLDTTATDLVIGGYQYSQDESLEGYIDELAIYNRALGAEEIASHYAVNTREVVADFPVHISEESTFEWNCEAENITGDTVTAALNSSFMTEITSDDIPDTQQTTYENAEDGKISGWDIYDNDPAGASITNVFDSVKQSRVIELSGYDIQNGFRLRKDDLSNWQNTSQFIAKWSMKFTGNFTIYIDVETTAGQRYIYYTPSDYDYLGTGQYVHHGLGSDSTNGGWITITQNLQQDLQEAQPGTVIIKVNSIMIRGNGRIDDISLLNPQTTYENAEDGKISGWDIYANDPAGASITNVFDSDKQSRVIEVSGFDIQNGFRLRKDDLSNWQNTSQFIAKWSMKFTGNFTIYFNVETTAGQRFIHYTPVDYDLLGTGQYVHHGLGSDSTNGGWITITRNLQQDLQEAQPEAVILKVNAILIRGNGRIDDILLQTFFNN